MLYMLQTPFPDVGQSWLCSLVKLRFHTHSVWCANVTRKMKITGKHCDASIDAASGSIDDRSASGSINGPIGKWIDRWTDRCKCESACHKGNQEH